MQEDIREQPDTILQQSKLDKECARKMLRVDVFKEEIHRETKEKRQVYTDFKRGLNEIFKLKGVKLRGFTCLQEVYQPDKELLFAVLFFELVKFSDIQPEVAEYKKQMDWIECLVEMNDDYNPIVNREICRLLLIAYELAERIVMMGKTSIKKILNAPDTDLILSKDVSVQNVLDAWDGTKGIDGKALKRECFISIPDSKNILFGWRIKELPTSNPHLKKVRFEFGHYSIREGEYLSSPHIVEMTQQIENDFRVEYGTSADLIRASYQGWGVFCIDSDTIPKDIHFPEKFPPKEVIDPLHYYLLQAPRAMRQAVWHGLPLLISKQKPIFTPREVYLIFQKSDRVKEDLAKNFASSFKFNPKLTFRYARQLGLWQASRYTAHLTSEQLDKIEFELPKIDGYKRWLKINENAEIREDIYTPFKHFINILCFVAGTNFEGDYELLHKKDSEMFDMFF